MTPPDLTQRQRLDLEEGKRLLSEVRRALTSDRLTPQQILDIAALCNYTVAAAEKAEKLREALQQARSALRTVQPLHVEDGLALNNDSVIRHALSRIDAALTPPASLPEEIQQ